MSQWEVQLNGTTIKKISDINIKDSLTQPMKQFKATMRHPSDSERATLIAGIGHLIGSHRITIYRKNVLKFDGFLESADPSGLDMVLQGRSFEVLLLDERTGSDVEFTAKTGAYILDDATSGILGNYSTKVTLSDITYTETLAGTVRFNHDNLLKAIAKVCNINQKDFWVTYTGAAFKLWVGSRTTNTEGAPGDPYYVGRDISVTVEKKGVLDVINRQRVFGSGDGINQIQVCVPWIDINLADNDRRGGFDGYNAIDDCTHAAATDSQTTYGIMEGKPHVDRSISSKANAIEIAKTILDENADLYQSLKVIFAKYVDLNVGDWIRVIDSKKGLDVTARIKTLNHRYGMQGIDSIDVELYNPFKATEDRINLAERDSDTTNTSGQGATNIFQVQSYENCDATHPLNVRFRLPDDIVQVNKVLMSFNIKNYRAYHTANAGESSHTHDLGIWHASADISDGDVFVLGVQVINSIPVIVVADNVSAPSVSTSDGGSSHTHSVTYGIYENSVSLPSVVATAGIDGSETTVDTYTTDQTDIDIVANVSTVGNWMNVKFAPNQAMRIEANIYVKCYIESK